MPLPAEPCQCSPPSRQAAPPHGEDGSTAASSLPLNIPSGIWCSCIHFTQCEIHVAEKFFMYTSVYLYIVYHLILPIKFSLLLPPIYYEHHCAPCCQCFLGSFANYFFIDCHLPFRLWVVLNFHSWVNCEYIIIQAVCSDSFWLRCTRNPGKTCIGEVILQEQVSAYSLKRFSVHTDSERSLNY